MSFFPERKLPEQCWFDEKSGPGIDFCLAETGSFFNRLLEQLAVAEILFWLTNCLT